MTPEELEAELRPVGFERIEQVGVRRLNEIYFNGRSDGLRLSTQDLGMLVMAWV